MKLVKPQKISASQLSPQEGLSVVGAFTMVEDALTELMGAMQIDGITVKAKYNAFWVFAKTKIRFFKPVVWGEECQITAWISSMTVARLFVDVALKNGQGEYVLYARVEMCVLDIATQKIKKISSVGVRQDMLCPDEIPLQPFEICPAKQPELKLCEQVTVRSTNIDHSLHTNNVEYLRFVINTYSVEQLARRAVREVEAVYVSQSHEGDVLSVLKGSCGNVDVIMLQNSDRSVLLTSMMLDKRSASVPLDPSP